MIHTQTRYIYIASKKGDLETKMVDDWVAVDIDEQRRVVGVEILDASERLDVEELKTLEFVEHGPPVSADEIRAELAPVHERKTKYEHVQSK